MRSEPCKTAVEIDAELLGRDTRGSPLKTRVRPVDGLPGPLRVREVDLQVVALIASFFTMVVGAVVGVRVLLLSRRTGQVPELLLGGSLLLYAAIGQPVMIASRPLGAALGYEARVAALCLSLLAIASSLVCLYLFTRAVFRPASRPALAAVWLGGGLAAVASVLIVTSIPLTPGDYEPATRLGLALLSVDFCVAMAWTATESLLYHRQMKRRLAVGLADPVVANRFLLWGTGCGVTSLVPVAMIACVAAGLDVVMHPLPLLLMSVAGVVISACWSLTFFPPARYVRWLAARA